MDDGLNLNQFRLSDNDLAAYQAAPKPKPKPPRHTKGKWFLKGPVPWDWLEAMAICSTGAGTPLLSLCLWREANRMNVREVKLCAERAGLGLSKFAVRRALRQLEKAKLVEVTRKPGRCFRVTLLNAPNADGT